MRRAVSVSSNSMRIQEYRSIAGNAGRSGWFHSAGIIQLAARSSDRREWHALQAPKPKPAQLRSGATARNEDDRIERFHSEEEACQEVREPDSSPGPDHDTDHRQQHALTNHHIPKSGSLRSKRHPNAEFLRALLNGIGHDSVDADCGHQQTSRPKDGEQQHVESLACDVAYFDLAHVAYIALLIHCSSTSSSG